MIQAGDWFLATTHLATPRYKLAVELADQEKSNSAEETDGTRYESFE
jgi:hypothetical protein